MRTMYDGIRKNPENTGSIWCAKNVPDWSYTTHTKYYKEDPQVDLGGVIIWAIVLTIAIGIFIIACMCNTKLIGVFIVLILSSLFATMISNKMKEINEREE